MRVATWGAGIVILGLSACAMVVPSGGPEAGPAGSGVSNAIIRNAVGLQTAEATASQLGDSLRVRLDVSRMPAGTYGAHVHTTGRCDAPDFTTAGPHWNPTSQQHGKNNPQGMHKGDLPNLMVGADGRGSLEITVPMANVSGGPNALLDADGASIVIHEKPDDYRTDPSGNSGARIACGVFG